MSVHVRVCGDINCSEGPDLDHIAIHSWYNCYVIAGVCRCGLMTLRAPVHVHGGSVYPP